MKRKRKDKMKTKLKRRDSLIAAAYSRQINLNVRVVKSKPTFLSQQESSCDFYPFLI